MPRTPTRRRLIEVADELFQRRGYAATGMAEILGRAGVGAGSFYYHFEAKEDLLLAILDHRAEIFLETVAGAARAREGDPVERIFALVEAFRRHLVEHDFALGSPLGGFALEAADALPAVQAKTAQLFARGRGAIEEALFEAGERLPAGLARAGLAALVVAVMEGAVMQARAERSVEPFDAAVAGLRDYVERLLAEGPSEAQTERRSVPEALQEVGAEPASAREGASLSPTSLPRPNERRPTSRPPGAAGTEAAELAMPEPETWRVW